MIQNILTNVEKIAESALVLLITCLVLCGIYKLFGLCVTASCIVFSLAVILFLIYEIKHSQTNEEL